MAEWQPIETAPKDGTVIDVWKRYSDGTCTRVTDAFWQDKPMGYGGPCGYDLQCGWAAANMGYDGSDHWVADPSDGDSVTHWMPLPEPPKPSESSAEVQS